MSALTKENLLIVQKELERTKTNHDLCATDDVVLTCAEVFDELSSVGSILGLEMLSSWAWLQCEAYNKIAWAGASDECLLILAKVSERAISCLKRK